MSAREKSDLPEVAEKGAGPIKTSRSANAAMTVPVRNAVTLVQTLAE
jgi:hypothetical protein